MKPHLIPPSKPVVYKPAFALLLLIPLLLSRPASATVFTISWLDTSSRMPYSPSSYFNSGDSFNLPGYPGTVTFSYTGPLAWGNLFDSAMQDGVITIVPDTYGWSEVNGSFNAVNYNTTPVDYTLTFTFNGPQVPKGQLALASFGLGSTTDAGPTIVTVKTNGTFLGDWSIGSDFAPTAFHATSQMFTLTNSAIEPANGYFNTQFGVTRINSATSSLTLNIHQIGQDGIGFTVGLIQTNPCANSCIAIYTPNNIVVSTCSNSVPVSYTVNASDNCSSNFTLVCSPPSGTNFSQGTNVVTCIVTDDLGNSNLCTFDVIVLQITNPPVITEYPTNISICAGIPVSCAQMPDVTGQVVAQGNSLVTVTQSIPPGTTLCSDTSVLLTASDSCGDSTNVLVPVTLVPCPTNCLDILCPTDAVLTVLSTNPVQVTSDAINLYVQTSLGVYVPFTPFVSSICCSNWTISFTPAFTNIPVGTTNTFTCTVTGCNQTNSCLFTIATICSCPPITAWPSNISIFVGANPCGPMPDETNNPQWWAPGLGTIQVTQSIPPGTSICSTTNVVFTVINGCGQTNLFTGTVSLFSLIYVNPVPSGPNLIVTWGSNASNALPESVVQSSTDLIHWVGVATVFTNSYTVSNITTAAPRGFFRVYSNTN